MSKRRNANYHMQSAAISPDRICQNITMINKSRYTKFSARVDQNFKISKTAQTTESLSKIQRSIMKIVLIIGAEVFA